MEQPTQFSAKPLSAQGNYGDKHQACSSRVLHLSNSAKILPKVASTSRKEQEAASVSRLSNVSDCYANRPQRKRGLTLEVHFSVIGKGGLRLPFHGITGYLHGLVSVYERPIIAGGRVWMIYSSITLLVPLFSPSARYAQIICIFQKFLCIFEFLRGRVYYHLVIFFTLYTVTIDVYIR